MLFLFLQAALLVHLIRITLIHLSRALNLMYIFELRFLRIPIITATPPILIFSFLFRAKIELLWLLFRWSIRRLSSTLSHSRLPLLLLLLLAQILLLVLRMPTLVLILILCPLLPPLPIGCIFCHFSSSACAGIFAFRGLAVFDRVSFGGGGSRHTGA